MSDAITVQVSGPRLIAQSLCALLNDFPDFRADEAVPMVSPRAGIAGPHPAVLLMVMPAIVAAGRREARAAQVATWVMPAGSPARLVVPGGFPPYRVAMVTSGAAWDLDAGCSAGLQIFLSVEDESPLLRKGVVAAAKDEAFCSPRLTPMLVGAVERQRLGIREARRAASGPGEKRDRSGAYKLLSRREIEVAEMAEVGLTNREIAAKLFISVNTVKTHIREILLKLELRRRSQIRI